MPVLVYCDLDGVLHRWPCPQAEMFDPQCIARLYEAIRQHDAVIVITSTWRLEWPLEQIRERMGVLGKRVIGVTPEIDDPFLRHGRYHEVLLDLERRVPDSRWIAIDDESGRFPGELVNLVLTDPGAGFSEKDGLALSRLLNSSLQRG